MTRDRFRFLRVPMMQLTQWRICDRHSPIRWCAALSAVVVVAMMTSGAARAGEIAHQQIEPCEAGAIDCSHAVLNGPQTNTGFGGTELVAASVLAAQRGGTMSAGPPPPSSAGSPNVILWDEARPSSVPNGAGSSGQNVIQITVQPR